MLARSPALYFGLRRLRGQLPPHLVSRDTQVVIEGFPRSGNSFAVRAFRHANPNIRIAHHTHAPAQLLVAVQRHIPVLCVVREPEAALRSFLARRPEIPPTTAISAWLAFHRTLARMRNDIEIASFEQVTTDFGTVIARLNRRYGTTFTPFRHTPENTDAVFREMDRFNAAAFGGQLRSSHVPRPHPDREGVKSRIDLTRVDADLHEARALYKDLSSSPSP